MTMLRLVPSSWRPPGGVLLVVLAVVGVAFVLRVVELGTRAMHHDESLHAMFAWYFAEGRGYEHHPLMHGPLLFHTVAAVFKVIGDGDVAARLPFAVAGTVLVLTPLLLRRWLGSVGTIAVAVLLALSPVLLYYSRFARNDVLVALWTVLLVVAVWRYREEGRGCWLAVTALALALALATKETVYLTTALLLLYVNATLTSVLLDQRGLRGHARLRVALLLFPVAWLLAVLWRPLTALRRRIGWYERPREADLLVVLGTIILPFLVAVLQFPFEQLEVSGARLGPLHFETVTIIAALTVSVVVGVLWSPRRWLLLAGIVAIVTVPLFTTWFTNFDGLSSAFWGQLDYWLEQQGVRRGNQPGFYYLMLLPLYEFLALVPALAGAVWLLWRGDRLMRLFAWWFVATFAMLSFAGEKMPWLTVHLSVPLAFLAGRALGVALPPVVHWVRSDRAMVWGRAAAGVAVVTAGLALALSLRTAGEVSFRHPGTPVEPLIYTQTAPDILTLADEIDSFVAPRSESVSVVVDTTQSLTWPWAWYLRDLPDVRYLEAEAIRAGELPEGAVLISASSTLPSGAVLRAQFADTRSYVHRWWFPEAGYRAVSFRSLFDDLRSGELLSNWVSFVAGNRDHDGLGILRGEVLFPAPMDGVAP